MSTNPTTTISEIRELRAKLGCGLREAKDAVERYGSAQAAMKALSPETADPRDPYAAALAAAQRWQAKSTEYKLALTRIQNSTTDPVILELIAAGLARGEAL